MSDITKLSKYVVLYFDLLGSKNRIGQNTQDNINSAHAITGYVCEIEKLFDDIELKIRIFSDNIVLAIPADDEQFVKKFDAMLMIASALYYLSIVNQRWLLRGAIVYGDFYINNNFLWGPALVNAYNLENKNAIYPRIIVEPSILKLPCKQVKETIEKSLIEDFDGLYYVDYMLFPNDNEYLTKYIETLTLICNDTFDDISIQQKYDWLRKNVLERMKNKSIGGINHGQTQNANP